MAIDVAAEETIRRPAQEVAGYATDPANDPAWIGGVVQAEQLGDGAVAAGSRVRRTAKFLGRRIDYVTEITDWRPPAIVTMKATSPFPMEITYSFAPDGEATRAGIRVRGEASGFFRLAAPLLARQVQRNLQGDLRRLKGILEG